MRRWKSMISPVSYPVFLTSFRQLLTTLFYLAEKARWAVTNRTNVAKILETSGTSITTKGNFYPAGKEPAPGELPKLYILVEGETEISVTTAIHELRRLLKEATLAASEGEARAPVGGRYTVL